VVLQLEAAVLVSCDPGQTTKERALWGHGPISLQLEAHPVMTILIKISAVNRRVLPQRDASIAVGGENKQIDLPRHHRIAQIFVIQNT